jgi:acetyl-CoA C-acetyltransferase
MAPPLSIHTLSPTETQETAMSSMSDPIVIVSAARTPIGGLLGDFANLSAAQLGAVAIRAAVERAGVPGDAVDEVLFGNCLMAGQGQAPARQAVLGAGLPISAGAVTLSKMCGSGMRAMMFAHDMLKAGSVDVMVGHVTFVALSTMKGDNRE